MAVMSSYYNQQLQRYQSDPKAAELLVHVGVEPVDASVSVARLAALTNVATVVMNSPDSYFIQ
jgi:hypothetical protein